MNQKQESKKIKEEMFNYQFSKKGLLETNLEKLYKKVILDQDKQIVIPVFGKPGTGKSSLSMQLQKFFKGEIDLSTWHFKHEHWNNEARSKPFNKFICYDEGRNTFNKKNAMTKQTKQGEDTLAQYRSFNNIHIINFQNAKNVIDDLLYYYSHAVIRVVDQGWAWVYSRQKAKKEIEFSRKKQKMIWGTPDFKASFKDASKHFPEKWSDYEDRKEKILKEKKKETVDDLEDESSDAETFNGVELDDEEYVDSETVAEMFDIKRRTVYKWVKDDKIPYEKLPTGALRFSVEKLKDWAEENR